MKKHVNKTGSVLVFIFLAAAVLLQGCGMLEKKSEKPALELRFFAFNTYMSITAYGDEVDSEVGTELLAETTALEKTLSVTDEASLVCELNKASASGTAFADASREGFDTVKTLAQRALEINRLTNGTFDITLYPVLKAWGFTTSQYRIPSGEELELLLKKVGSENLQVSDTEITLDCGTMIDFGGIAKGYLGDVLKKRLEESGVSSALLSLGGNTTLIGRKPNGELWKIGIADPTGKNDIIGYVTAEDTNVITSGGYMRFFEGEDGEKYSHIIDPSSGKPAKSGLLSVTVTGKDGALCDALSTALYVMGPEKAEQFWRNNTGFEIILVEENGSISVSEGISGNFVPEKAYEAVKILHR